MLNTKINADHTRLMRAGNKVEHLNVHEKAVIVSTEDGIKARAINNALNRKDEEFYIEPNNENWIIIQ